MEKGITGRWKPDCWESATEHGNDNKEVSVRIEQTIFVLFLDTFHSRMNETFYLETGSLRKIMHPIRDFLSRHEG